ncbi:MAG: ABC transporter substrate-binding protein [Hyphomicrobiales bacterium]|nr:ABC transporter substrate-binding protein [Hyphomicrobiales bacterium]MCP5372798.1 ABC transporter substrate-binding protein [Hyphomicrobiales bacterium]
MLILKTRPTLWRTLAAATVLAAAALSAPGAATAADKSVKVTAIVEHPALDACRNGVKDELAARGYTAGKNLDWEFQSAQGDVGTAGQIARKFVGDKPDVIVAIATPSAQAAVAAARGGVPVIFTAVTDPVAAKLIKDRAHPGGNVSGVTDLSPIDLHLKLIKEITPNAKKIGVPHNPGEANAVVLVNLLRDMAPKMGMEVVVASAPSTNDVLPAARSLVGKVDVIYVPTDNTIVSALEAVIKVGIDAQIPVYAGDTDSVPRGAIAALGFNYYDIGRQTGAMVARVLGGEKPGDIAVEGVQKGELFVNPGAARKMGVTIPAATVQRAKKVVE